MLEALPGYGKDQVSVIDLNYVSSGLEAKANLNTRS